MKPAIEMAGLAEIAGTLIANLPVRYCCTVALETYRVRRMMTSEPPAGIGRTRRQNATGRISALAPRECQCLGRESRLQVRRARGALECRGARRPPAKRHEAGLFRDAAQPLPGGPDGGFDP
ncbi:MAG: hypothetical protein OHK0044_13790 [Burkholderiaceae bacterium]